MINNSKKLNCHNKLQQKLIVLLSTLAYINSKYNKYNQKNILYYFNENLKRNGLAPTTLRTMQNYLYKLEKVLKVTTNYYQHMGVNCGTEIYYKLKYPKKECYQKINKYFKERKNSRFKSRVNNHFKDNVSKNSSVNSVECLSNKNNIKEERKIKEIEKYQVIKYFNKCNFLCKEILPILLTLNIDKDNMIKIIKIIKRIEINLTKNKNTYLNVSYFKEKQNKLKKILRNTQQQLEKNGYNPEQLETNFQKIYKNYKTKPHFIIENHKYKDLSHIKRKLEKSIERKKENLQKDCENMRTNIFNILIEQLKKEVKIDVLKPILKIYLNSKNKLEYNKVFNNNYYYELLEIIKKEKNPQLKEVV
ncbi:plasmid maintenance protein [Borreliella burgdorferi]|uniref:plasmid maintenance protein n=1 Tax=Borreliella burgdorferi TaxID=139 RepID=UPI001E5DC165|nr:plasmid maintenance protein [Borreliella burgdorferi]MCD2392273.1 plasmid maintenance protein [Borreliella burgdorferi]